jgi:cytoskeletal protein RodZ
MFKCDLSQKMKNDSKYSAYNIIRCVLQADSKYFNENQCRPYLWKKYRKEKSTFDYKNVVEHAICVILILLGVNYLHSSIFYNGVSPPLFGDADDDTKKSEDEAKKSKDSKEVDTATDDAKTTTTTATPASEAAAASAAAATAATEAAKAAKAAAAELLPTLVDTLAAAVDTSASAASAAAAAAAAQAPPTEKTAEAAEIEPEKEAKPPNRPRTWKELLRGPRPQSEAEKEALSGKI